ncbi:MAG: phosphopantothenoylcysteine decarboxylase [Candidatus Omnitrophica bacterium]|nr:phosphopantothenoylcysteine decarboxylase [Candidatus Omnitrophota bacterium]
MKNRKKVLITAGPTVEELDPVRYISNYSTGTMGYSLAREAVNRGYEVALISGPVSIPAPHGAKLVKVTTAREMLGAVKKHIGGSSCLVMAAAVCDFAPAKRSATKIKKRARLVIQFTPNPDILGEVKDVPGVFKVGFALETGGLFGKALCKLKAKGLDLIVANKAGRGRKDGGPFGAGKKDFMVISRDGRKRTRMGVTKEKMAGYIFDDIEKAAEAA